MIFLAVYLILVEVVTAQYQTTAVDQLQPTTQPKKEFYKIAPLHYVNIGAQLAGDYKFGYDTGKGPMGQSFRQEVRLADGSVQGSYGVIDELGHKRVVHYTSGTAGSVAENGNNQLSSLFNGIQRQSQSLSQTFDSLRQQPSNYLQARMTPVQYSSPSVLQHEKTNRLPTPVDDIENRLPNPLLSDIVLPLYKTHERSLPALTQKEFIPQYTQTTSAAGYAQQPTSVPGYVPKTSFVEYEQKAAVASTLPQQAAHPAPIQRVVGSPEAQRSQVVEAGGKRIRATGDTYKSEIKRVTKKPSARLQRTQAKVVVDEPTYPTTEIDYYDTVPAFIDIERLSYNIGSRSKA